MKKESYISSFKNFNPLKSKFDQFIFKKGQTLLIIQVCINLLVFLLEDNNPFSHRNTFSWYELTFYLFAMFVLAVEMIVAKDFFENIPRTFDELITDLTQFTRTATFMLPYKSKINLAVLRKVS